MIIYTASKVHRADMWKGLRYLFPAIVFGSSWIDSTELEKPNEPFDPIACRRGWVNNIKDVVDADKLIAYAEAGDDLNGTLVEIGAMLAANEIETGGYPVEKSVVYLVGDYDWKTWKYHPRVHTEPINTKTGPTPMWMVGEVLHRILKKEI